MPALPRSAGTRACLLATVLVLAGCANSVAGSGSGGSGAITSSGPTSSGPTSSGPTSSGPTSSGPTSNGPTPTTSGGSSGFPTSVDSLGISLLKGMTSIKSAHLELLETTNQSGVRGIGDETLADGKVTGMDLTETVGTTTLRFLLSGTQIFAKLPPEYYSSTKPWVLITPATTNTRLKSIYDGFQSSAQTSAGKTIATFVDAAGSLKLLGTEQFDGVEVGHYAIAVDVSKLPTDFNNRQALVQSGLKSIPVEIYVDHEGITRKVTEHLTVASTTVDVKVTLTNIDAPVTITAPPSDQVEQG